MTLNELLQQVADELEAAGYVHSQREAEIILGHFSQSDTAKLYTHGETEANLDLAKKVLTAAAERVKGRPIAYIVGTQPFLGFHLKSDERALIPRPETEQLVEFLVKQIRQNKLESGSVLEIGTGSGAISIALQKYFPSLKITATDISADALELAEDNANQLGVKIDFIESDLFKSVPKKKYDVIVANLPYVPTQKLAFVSDEILDWEPMVAIDAGDDGFLYISQLLENVKDYLKPNGIVALEMWHTHPDLVRESVKKHLPNFEVEILQDLAGFDRFAFVSNP